MSKLSRARLEPWNDGPVTEAEAQQATYNRLARRYKGLDANIIRAAWRRNLDMEPTDQIVEGIRTGRRLRFR